MRLVLIAIYLAGSVGMAQTSPPPTAPPPAPCQSELHHQFDFWIGQWNVTANGNPAGFNNIRPLHGGCVLHESWRSAAGTFTGDSLNMYDAGRDVWHQTWTDSSGLLLQLEGHFKDGAMTMRGERPAASGNGSVMHEIQWTPNPDGSVRQVWRTSSDAGSNWQTAFDGLYQKAAP